MSSVTAKLPSLNRNWWGLPLWPSTCAALAMTWGAAGSEVSFLEWHAAKLVTGAHLDMQGVIVAAVSRHAHVIGLEDVWADWALLVARAAKHKPVDCQACSHRRQLSCCSTLSRGGAAAICYGLAVLC